MPVYGPKASETAFRGGKNILASEHLQFIEAGATLDGTNITDDYYETGQLIGRDSTTGKWVIFDATNTDIDQAGITNVDFEVAGEDLVIGEVIVRGSVYEAKLADVVPVEFKDLNPLIRYVTHVY